MDLPKLKEPFKYMGLYVIDFGGHCGVGFTAQETADVLESENYRDCKVYKIHRAYPDGRLELKGVRRETFELESGMFFYSNDFKEAQGDFEKLIGLAKKSEPPCRAKVQMSKSDDSRFVTAIIYPAEYDDEMSLWLLDGGYKTNGEAMGGSVAVERYYKSGAEILERHQLFSEDKFSSRTGKELFSNLKAAVQR